jgi:thymidylate synthase
MKQYLDLLNKILTEGVEKESGRPNMPNTIGISNAIIKMDLSEGFPLLTTKKMFLRGIITELLWFLKGDTNIKYLVDNNVHIWDDEAYKWYLKYFKDSDYGKGGDIGIKELSLENFVKVVKENSAETLKAWFGSRPGYSLGDLGKVYGYQWRNQNGVDQVKEVLEGLKTNPYSRYHIIDGWSKADFKDMALPPCHLLYQFIVRPLSYEQRVQWMFDNDKNLKRTPEFNSDLVTGKEEYIKYFDENNVPKFYLDLNMYQRSCDSACGIPFNLASMSLLLEIFSKVSNMIPGVATWIGGDTHIYVNHIETVKEQIKRTPYKLPTIKILKDIKTLDDILTLTINDFELNGYQSHGKLKYELFVGLKK